MTAQPEGLPEEIFETQQACGFTHVQQSGNGAIRKYYNSVRVTPMVQPVDDLGQAWPLHDDVTNVIRSCLREERFGAAVALLTTFLAHDEVVAVSEYTRDQIVLSAEAVDAHCGTLFAQQCRARVTVSYPPIDAGAYLDLDPATVDAALARRGLERDGYVLFLSRITKAKGIHDLAATDAGPSTPRSSP